MTHPFTPGSSICAYLRDSGGNRQELSVIQQEERVRAWAAENDLVLSHIFADVAQSGGSTVGRDQMDAMLKYFEQQPPDAGVVFWDYSRWARNYDDGQYMLSLLRRRGYLVYSLEEYVPPGSTGKIVESLHLWSAEQYREQLSKNVKRGLAYMISNHRAYFYPSPPVGYRFKQIEIGLRRDGSPHTARQIEPDPDTAPLVQKAFAMRAGGASYREIYAALKLPGVLKKTYRRIFRNRIYIGIFDYGGNSYPGYCEPIIDQGTWHAVRQVAAKWQSGESHPRQATSRHLLSGIAWCNRCGGMLHGKRLVHETKRGQREYLYYCCANSITATDKIVPTCEAPSFRAERLNDYVFQFLREKVMQPEVLALAYSEAQAHQAAAAGDYNAALATARKHLANLNAAAERILDAITETGHSRLLLDRLTRIEHERNEAQIQVIDLETQAARPLPDLDIDELVREGLAILEHGAFRQKQLFIRSFVRRIDVEWVDEFVGTIEVIMPGGEGVSFSIQVQ